MTIERMHIRHYVTELLKAKIDVGGRVFANRPSKVFADELPIVMVAFASENVAPWVGDARRATVQERELTLHVELLAEEPPAANKTNPNEGCEAEDTLDRLSDQVERTLFGDPFLEKNLPNYDPDRLDNEGLATGLRLESVDAFDVNTRSEKRVVGQQLTFVLTYVKDVHAKKRLPNFATYSTRIVNSADSAVTDAEGEVQP